MRKLRHVSQALTPIQAFECFFFHDAATTEIYTLSLHDALPILGSRDTRDRATRIGAARIAVGASMFMRSEEHTSELQSQSNLVCRLLLEKKKLDLKDRIAVPPRPSPRPQYAPLRSILVAWSDSI